MYLITHGMNIKLLNSVMKASQLMLRREIIRAYSEIKSKHINTLCVYVCACVRAECGIYECQTRWYV
jgi:hypothetical protein